MFRKLLSKTFNYNQKIIDNINRLGEREPILLKWATRGSTIINLKDLKFRKYFFYVFSSGLILVTLFILILPIFMYLNYSIFFKIGATIGLALFYAPIIIIMYFASFEIKHYDYYLTSKMIELVSWQEGVIFGIFISKIFLWFLTAVCLIAFMIEPSAILAGFGGLTAIGAIAGAKVFSKEYIETHLEYQHLLTTWDKVLKIEITELLSTVYIWGDNLNCKGQARHLFYLFYTPENKEQLIELVKQKAQQHNLTIVYSDE